MVKITLKKKEYQFLQGVALNIYLLCGLKFKHPKKDFDESNLVSNPIILPAVGLPKSTASLYYPNHLF